MSEIHKIIERSRAQGGFLKKGHFTLASHKARIKMSDYALPDPHYYCLEIIQSAVALGAKRIDVSSASWHCVVSFEDKHYERGDLEHLFDFLMTTRDEDSFRARRRLAIGVAAALHLRNSSVAIETGDGTLKGSTRFEINDIEGQATIGDPEEPITGTYIKVRRPVDRVLGSIGLTSEELVMSKKCVYLSAALSINGVHLFGRSSSKAIETPRYRHWVPFDEGDLYGGIGLAPNMVIGTDEKSRLDILTNGVWITSLNIDMTGGIGGVVGYDRLHKTASQYDIAKDERLDELTARLAPYADVVRRRAGMDDADRLALLFEKETPFLRLEGEPYYLKLGDADGVSKGQVALHLNSKSEEKLILHVLQKDPKIHIDSVTLPFSIPLVGTMEIMSVTFNDVCFRKPGEPDFNPMRVVGLKADFYDIVKEALKRERENIEAHFSSEWQRVKDESKKAEVEAKVQAEGGDEEPEPAEQLLTEDIFGELEPAPERVRSPDDVPIEPVTRPAPQETFPLPSMDEISDLLAEANTDYKLRGVVITLARKIFDACGRYVIHKRKIEWSDARMDWDRPLVAKCLANLKNRPEEIYSLAVLILGEINDTEREPYAAEEMRLHEIVLEMVSTV
ncbi:MAG: hypothetical protein GY854_11920 [Deltaproteobacteria bacterium]|nr:hypothetical protein [Deltaproteobacteria bacterium]